MIIGDIKQFGFEILSDDLTSDLAELYICIAGHRVCSRGPVYLSSFVYHLAGFYNAHQSQPPSDFDFSGLSHEAAFHLLSQVFRSGKEVDGLTSENVWNYFGLHSLDDAVDDFDIYVNDVNDQKHFACRLITSLEDPDDRPREIWHTNLPRHEFLRILEQFLKLFPALATVARKSGRYQEGDLLEIPLPDGRVAVGWLLEILRHPQDLASFVVLGIQGEIHADEIFLQDFKAPPSTSILGPLYTAVNTLAQNHCIPSTHHPVPAVNQQAKMAADPTLLLDMTAIYNKIEQTFGKT